MNKINNEWIARNVFFKLNIWEDFIDSIAKRRLQDEYNKAIRECDIFIMLFFTKVGQYTLEEFESAFGQFKETSKPVIYTYFKDDLILTGDISESIISLLQFKKKLLELGHFVTRYKSIEDLQWQFGRQIDKMYGDHALQSYTVRGDSTPAEIDSIAQILVNKLLSKYENGNDVNKDKLKEAIKKSSDLTRHTIYLLAQQIRKESWLYEKEFMERTIPVFEALIESDKRKEHYYYGQLGYALKDKIKPDWEAARDNFNIAIDLRGAAETSGWYFYEFNRAWCNIMVDKSFANEMPSAIESRKLILNDLKIAKEGFGTDLDDMLKKPDNRILIKWLNLNKARV